MDKVVRKLCMKRVNLTQAAAGLDPTVCHCFLPCKTARGGFLRARTLSQKNAFTERIQRLVFTAFAVATIGPSMHRFIHFTLQKDGRILPEPVPGKQRSPWSKKRGRY
ncbi:hypothetical protein EMIT048CA2_50308 [Pseudomonas chlororaphis]